jgi:alpha-beta hydrolase superfamily lysophospholipase
MIYTSKRSTSTSGLSYFIHVWEPETEPVAQVLLLHGYAEHAMRYEPLVNACCDASIRVVAPDHIGHGQSAGTRGYIPKMEIAVDDAKSVFDEMVSQHPDLPTFVFGHSMGGVIAVLMAEMVAYNTRGLLLSAPAFQVINTPRITHIFAPIPAAIMPKVTFLPLKSNTISRDPEASRKYREDPLNYTGKVRFGMGWQLIRSGWKALSVAPGLTMPLWIGHGDNDKLIGISGAKKFASMVRSEDLTFKTVEGARHEILNEPEGPGLIVEIVDWMKKRI